MGNERTARKLKTRVFNQVTRRARPIGWDGTHPQRVKMASRDLIFPPSRTRLGRDALRTNHHPSITGWLSTLRAARQRSAEATLSHNYWFPRMHAFVKSYVATCEPCSPSKPSRHLRHGELAPLHPAAKCMWIWLTKCTKIIITLIVEWLDLYTEICKDN